MNKVTDSQTLKSYFEVYPQQSVVPDAMWQTLLDEKKQLANCFRQQHPCFLLAVDLLGDSGQEYVLFGKSRYSYQHPVYAFKDRNWEIAGYVTHPYRRSQKSTLLRNIKRGEYRVKSPDWRVLEVGGNTFSFKLKAN